MLAFSFMVGAWEISLLWRLTPCGWSCSGPEMPPRLVPMPLYPTRFCWLISENCRWWPKVLWLNLDSSDYLRPPRLLFAFFLLWIVPELFKLFPLDPLVLLRLFEVQRLPFSLECYLFCCFALSFAPGKLPLFFSLYIFPTLWESLSPFLVLWPEEKIWLCWELANFLWLSKGSILSSALLFIFSRFFNSWARSC